MVRHSGSGRVGCMPRPCLKNPFFEVMAVNLKKCHTLDADLSRRVVGEVHPSASIETETPLPLPPGFDSSLFTPEQTEYISDLFVATVRDYLTRLDSLLCVTEPGVSPTALRMGVNWQVLRKLTGICPKIAAMPWNALFAVSSVRSEIFNSQRRALFAALRKFSAQPLTTKDHGSARTC